MKSTYYRVMEYALIYTWQNSLSHDISEFAGAQTYRTKKAARETMREQLDILSNHEKANEYQPTSNAKDQFHFYIQCGDHSEKRGFFIAQKFKNSFRNFSEWKEQALKRGLIRF